MPALTEALDGLGPARTKQRALVLADLAANHRALGNDDQARELAAEAHAIGVERAQRQGAPASPPGRVSTARMVGMTGHAGLPPPTAELVTTALRDRLRAYTLNLVGVTMLGPGADQLFARVVLELGGTLYVVQPTTGMQYRDGFEDPEAARRGYDELYGQASHVEALEHTESTEQAHMDGGQVGGGPLQRAGGRLGRPAVAGARGDRRRGGLRPGARRAGRGHLAGGRQPR